MKTIIPAQAMAKISTRLVPDQDPHKIRELLTEFIKGQLPNTIKWDLIYISGSKACITDRTNYLTKSYYDAIKQVWGVDPVYKREGGSIPVVGYMQKILKIDSVLSGFALPDDNIHAPNEKLDLGTWYKGIDSIIHYFYSLGLISK
jgi:acetylornithine deacetylase/succinyl-diaminopimelate desuccinylase-like protein